MTTHTRKGYERSTTRHGRYITGKSEDGRALRSNDDLTLFWIEGLYETERQGYESSTNASVIVDGDKIFSFGKHFEMARIVRTSNGRPRMILTSADTWSSQGWGTTSNHQSMVRSVITAHKGELPVLEIPFSAVNAAGIDLDSIRPLEIRDSRYTYHEISNSQRPGPLAYVRDENGEAKYKTPSELEAHPEWTVDPHLSVVDYDKSGMQHASGTGAPAELREDGLWHWTVQRHWMGDSIFRAKSTEVRQRPLTRDELKLRDEWAGYSHEAERMMAFYRGSYVEGEGYDESWLEARDRLRLEAAELQSQLPPATRLTSDDVSFTVVRWATYLSSFDYDEPHRPYFLCELPYGCKAQTVDEGFDALMPLEIRTHIGMGDKVLRQGDVYAVPTTFRTETLESLAAPVTVHRFIRLLNEAPWGEYEDVPVLIRKRGAKKDTYPNGSLDIFGSNHQVTHLIVTNDGRYFGRGRMVHAPAHRDPDHRVVKLEEGVWYEFMKNTVPTMTTRNGRRQSSGNSVFQSGQSRAWAVGGGVD